MKRISALLVAMALTVGVALPAAAATASDFAGTWTSVDAADDSNQAMYMFPAGTDRVRVVLYDDGGTVCGPDLDPLAPVIAWGVGSISGDDLSVSFNLRCSNGVFVPRALVVFTYDSSTDTLTDTGSPGTIWYPVS